MTALDWRHIYVAETVLNALIATSWALAAAWNARRTPYLTWPLSWRWIVFNWMGSKAGFFWLLTLAIVAAPLPVAGGLPDGPVELIYGVFTLCHWHALWRWLHLPDTPAAPDRSG